MTATRLGAAFLLCAACTEREAGNQAGTPPSLTVTYQSENAVAGSRPTLTLTCGSGGASFSLGLPHAGPRSSATALIKLDEGTPTRIPLLPLETDQWAPRLDHGEESSLVSAMAAARNIYFVGPEGQSDLVIRWDLSRLGARAAEVRQACAAIPVRP